MNRAENVASRASDGSPVDSDEQLHRLATLGILAGSIAHEVNNILTPVLSYAQLALQSPDDAELARKALTKSAEGAEKAGHIMSSLLGFARSGGQSRVADVAECLDQATGCIGWNLDRENIVLESDIEPGLTARISPMALQQVLLNLILNARDAITPKGGSLRISARCSTWNSRQNSSATGVEIVIEDNGCGMEPELLESAFLPFVTKRHNPANGHGTGLGLPICKQLVEEVGGRISATSHPGDGTRFVLCLEKADRDASSKAA